MEPLNDRVIEWARVVWDYHRILTYPAKGFQIPQEVPESVMDAYRQLIDVGYNQHLG